MKIVKIVERFINEDLLLEGDIKGINNWIVNQLTGKYSGNKNNPGDPSKPGRAGSFKFDPTFDPKTARDMAKEFYDKNKQFTGDAAKYDRLAREYLAGLKRKQDQEKENPPGVGEGEPTGEQPGEGGTGDGTGGAGNGEEESELSFEADDYAWENDKSNKTDAAMAKKINSLLQGNAPGKVNRPEALGSYLHQILVTGKNGDNSGEGILDLKNFPWAFLGQWANSLGHDQFLNKSNVALNTMNLQKGLLTGDRKLFANFYNTIVDKGNDIKLDYVKDPEAIIYYKYLYNLDDHQKSNAIRLDKQYQNKPKERAVIRKAVGMGQVDDLVRKNKSGGKVDANSGRLDQVMKGFDGLSNEDKKKFIMANNPKADDRYAQEYVDNYNKQKQQQQQKST